MHAMLSYSRLVLTNATARHTESESVSSNSRETPPLLNPRVSGVSAPKAASTESTIISSSLPTEASNASVPNSAAKASKATVSNPTPASNSVALASSVSVPIPAQPTLTSSLSVSNQATSSKKQWTHKGSPQLMRWARSRRIRSLSPSKTIKKEAGSQDISFTNGSATVTQIDKVEEDDDDDVNLKRSQPESIIYMVSDGTGWTAEHCVHAALGQFEHCLVDHVCPVNTHLFSQINDPERLIEIIKDARKENATFVYTLADPDLAQTAKKACKLYGVPSLDILGPITELLGSHMGVPPSGLPRGAPGSRNVALTEDYFKRIEAIEFTIKQDDGALPQNLHKADLVLVGVSRTSKTPLSTYMAQKGYKVANVPLVFGIDPPKELFEIDQSRIYGLTIDANFLQAIRQARYKTLGVSSTSFYSAMDHIKKELQYSNKLFSQNPTWPVIAVTGKAIEETAAVILRIYHDREKKHSMPRISYRY